MKKDEMKQIIHMMTNFVSNKKMSFWVVGSLGYRNAIADEEKMNLCDDIDCIFVYEDIDELAKFQYLSTEFLNEAKKSLLNGKIDMFSNKFYINNIQISADYISREYLEKLGEEKITGENKYRKKLNDSPEKDQNTYCNILGEKLVYKKPCEKLKEYNIYTLPIHLFVDNKFYPGVLLNKFLYNPACLSDGAQSRQIAEKIFKQVDLHCKSYGESASVYNTFYKKDALTEKERVILGWK